MPAEMEHIRQALLRDNPNMPTSQSYAIATAAYLKKYRRGGYDNGVHNDSTDGIKLRHPNKETNTSN